MARATPGLTPEDQAHVAAEAAKQPVMVADYPHISLVPAADETWEEVNAPREPRISTYTGCKWVK